MNLIFYTRKLSFFFFYKLQKYKYSINSDIMFKKVIIITI